MNSLVFNRSKNIIFILLTFLIISIVSLSNILNLYASGNSIELYSLNSYPGGEKALEHLISGWWNWWVNVPGNISHNWPTCLEGNTVIGNNHHIVFLGDPASALPNNVKATNQKCEISSNQQLYLTVYSGECSTGSKPNEGEYPTTKSPADLLNCAQDSNRDIKLMSVKVDGKEYKPNIIRQTTQPFSLTVNSESNPYDWKKPIVGGNNTSLAESYYLFFKSLPIGNHLIELEVIRAPAQTKFFTSANQPAEHDVAKWNIKVVP